MTKTTSWRELIRVHPAAELFPLMNENELAALAADIKTNGLKLPIETWRDRAGEEWVLDGRNRLNVLERLGYRFARKETHVGEWTYPEHLIIYEPDSRKTVQVRQHGNGECPYELAASFNINRRHLTAVQKRELIEKLLKENPERSDRATAKIAKADHKTVAAVRQEIEGKANGEIPHKADRVEASGRKARGRKPGGKKSAKAEEAAATASISSLPSATAEAQPPAQESTWTTRKYIASSAEGHTSNRPLIEIKVLARNDWQTKALDNEPTNPEEAMRRFYALGWESAAIYQRYNELITVQGKVLEDAKRFFPNLKEWKAWLKRHKTCPASSAETNHALNNAGYSPEGGKYKEPEPLDPDLVERIKERLASSAAEPASPEPAQAEEGQAAGG